MKSSDKVISSESESYLLVPKKFLQDIEKSNKILLNKISCLNLKDESLGDFVPEKIAKPLIGKSTTWFFYARRGEKIVGGKVIKLGFKLPFRKVGSTNYYRKSDLIRLIEGSLNTDEGVSDDDLSNN
jgi:hypothetical protein